jgi:type III pantothenate kinase
MKKILAIDIGNTNITVGRFAGKALLKRAKISTDDISLYAKKFASMLKHGVDEAVIASVSPLSLARVICELRKISPDLRIIILGKDKIVPIKNLYRRPKEVGQDRLVNAFGAVRMYGAPAVIVDFGTAITFDVVSTKGHYLGGLILPGIAMGLESLYEKTALLPRVRLKKARSIIGKDTVNSMRAGILFGYGAMCDGLMAKYRKLFGPGLKVIATGGNASLMKNYARSIDVVDPDLTIRSLALISIIAR